MKICIVKQPYVTEYTWQSVRFTSACDLMDKFILRSQNFCLVAGLKADIWVVDEGPIISDTYKHLKQNHPRGIEALYSSHKTVTWSDIPWSEYDIVISADQIIPDDIIRKYPATLWCYFEQEHTLPSFARSAKKPDGAYDLFLNHHLSSSIQLERLPQSIAFPYTANHDIMTKLLTPTNEPKVFLDSHMIRGNPDNIGQIVADYEKKCGLPVKYPQPWDFANSYECVGKKLTKKTSEHLKDIARCKYFLLVRKAGIGQGAVEAASLGLIVISDSNEIYSQLLCHPACFVLPMNYDQALQKVRSIEADPALQKEILEHQKTALQKYFWNRPIGLLKRALELKRSAKESSHASSMVKSNNTAEILTIPSSAVRKRISIVFSGRNDSYGGNFKEKLLAAWKRNSVEFNCRGIEAEWIFVEWNPLDKDYLSYTLGPLGFKCYIVSPAIHKKICTNPNMTFMQFWAKNVGIRRASNPWVLATNADCIFGPKVLDFITAEKLNPNIIYRAERRDIEPGIFSAPFNDMFQKTVYVHDSQQGVHFTQAAGDFVLFNKDSVNFGYDENITFSDAYLDGRFLKNWVTKNGGTPSSCIKFIGSVFKEDHPLVYRRTSNKKNHHKGKLDWNYDHDLPYGPSPNWGLANHQIKRLAANIWYIKNLFETADDKRVSNILGEPGHFTEGILFDDFKVLIDSRSVKMGGSWVAERQNDVPIAYEMENIKFFYERTLEFEHPTILDVGAHVGDFCLLAKINPNIRGYAFEPSPQIYEILKNNVNLNGLKDKIKTFQIALADRKGKTILKYPNSNSESGLACIGNPSRFNDWTEIEIPVTTLDEFAAEEAIKKVDLIKIDTEGCELFVLKGAERIINEHHPGILLECQDINTDQFGYHPQEVIKLLSSWGYDNHIKLKASLYFYQPQSQTSVGLAIQDEFSKKISLAEQRESKQQLLQQEKAQVITIFAMPRPFNEAFALIQENAIRSWMQLNPRPEIILFGKDEGVAEFAKEYNLKHVPVVECNEYGTPLVSDLFEKAQAIAQNEICVYINSDIILLNDFTQAIQKVHNKFNQFLMIGRRWDLDVTEPIDFNDKNWQQNLITHTLQNGRYHAITGIDYFAFKKGLWASIPPFALGRYAWDNWLVYSAIDTGQDVIDVSEVVSVVHQNHNFSNISAGRNTPHFRTECEQNLKLYSGAVIRGYTSDANWVLTPQGFFKRKLGESLESYSPVQLFQIGLDKMNKDDCALALDIFEQVLSRKANIFGLNCARAVCFAKLKKLDEAAKAVNDELHLFPNNEAAHRIHQLINKMKNVPQRQNFDEQQLSTVEKKQSHLIADSSWQDSSSEHQPKFSFVMIALNAMPFIEYSLKSIYDFAHEIIIVEGAVEKCMFAANPDGSSNDGTVEFIRSFPDPLHKIKFIQGKWLEKCQMQNEALKFVTGNYVWLIDSDEVYRKEHLQKIREILNKDLSITQVNFIPDNFWKGLDYIFVSPKFFQYRWHYRRLFKFVPGAAFTTHRPPTMVWPGSDQTTEQMNLLDGLKTREMGIILYHYSYVLDEQVKQKIELYKRYGWDKSWNVDLDKWYNECFLRWTPENRYQIDAKYPIWTGDRNSHTQPFTGIHPEVMAEFKAGLAKEDLSPAIRKSEGTKTSSSEPAEQSPLKRDVMQKAGQEETNVVCSQEKHTESKLKNILWARSDSIGDNVLAASMLPYIRPCPFADDIVVFDKKRIIEDNNYRQKIISRLRTFKPVLFLNSTYSRDPLTDALAFESGASERIGMDGDLSNITAELKEQNNQCYSLLVPSEGKHKLEFERHRDFLCVLGIDTPVLEPMIWIASDDEEFAEKFFEENRLDSEHTIALFPGAQNSNKAYERYESVLKNFDDFKFLILGGSDTKAQADEICKMLPDRCLNLVGKTTIRQMAAIIRRCRIYLGSESAGAHIACAVNTPNVVLVGGGHFGRFLPYSPLTSMVSLPLQCYGCNWQCGYQRIHCIKDIEPEVITEALRRSLDGQIEKPRVFVQADSLWRCEPHKPAAIPCEDFLNSDSVEIVSVGQMSPAFREHYNGLIFLKQGRVDAAYKALTKALEEDPNSVPVRNSIAKLYLRKGQLSDALRHLIKALKIEPYDRPTVLNCAQVLISSGKIKDARKLYNSYLQRNPFDNEIAEASQNLSSGQKKIHRRDRKDNPLVSVVIPAYNGDKYIAEAIESVLIQNYRDFELIIVDDGSTDSTKDIITSFKDDRIKYFYKENTSPAGARNIGIRKSNGSFIINLDTDDMIVPDFIIRHLKEFEKHPQSHLIYCDECLIDENGKQISVVERPQYSDRKALIRDLFRCGAPVVPFGTCIRKSVFEKIGLFDETLRGGEDYDMMRRFVENGLKAHHLRENLYLRRITDRRLSRHYSAQKAKSHFEVVSRFIDTFSYDELFPDVQWYRIPPENRHLHAKCLAAVTYLAIGQAYVKSNSIFCASEAFDQACSVLNDCLQIDPSNQRLRQMLQKSELVRAKYTGTALQAVY
ncbi:MAG: FkbM family methyltransferase [Planctomycetota bacterium]|jgi:FkbM family methyltransferase